MEIINIYRQTIPATTFVGIPYTDTDRLHGSFAHKWQEWFQTSRFAQLEPLITESFRTQYEECNAYVGLMRIKIHEPFTYWIGMFLPPNITVPEGFSSISFDSFRAGICWILGTEDELYCNEEIYEASLKEHGIDTAIDQEGANWSFERYVCPRFTQPDHLGKQILDVGFLVE